MQPIDNIMKLRKGYAIKLYEYFNHVQNKVDAKITIIKEQSDNLLKEEELQWQKLTDSKITLDKFDKQIESLLESKGVLDKKRISEVKTLRHKLETKYFDHRDEYQVVIKKIEKSQHQWLIDLQTYLLEHAQKQKIIQRLNKAVASVYPDLKDYCQSWKDEPINRLKRVITDAKNIETYCGNILIEIKLLQALTMDQQHLIDIKNKEIPIGCEKISKMLDNFITNLDYVDILEKIKDTNPFVDDFFKIFKDSGFTSLRASIRLVGNIQNTEKKLITIAENFQHIQIIFEQVLEKLYIKKKELLDVCTDAEEFSKKTCEKWLNTQYTTLLNLNEQIHQKRNEFVVNENIL